MNKKKTIITVLIFILIILVGGFIYLQSTNHFKAATKKTKNTANKPNSTDSKVDTSQAQKNLTQKLTEQMDAPTFSSNLLNRQVINGYYYIQRKNGAHSYVKITNDGLADFVTPTNYPTHLDYYKFTPLTSGNAKKYEYQLSGGLVPASFTILNNNEMTAVQPNFNRSEGMMVYKRISKTEYDTEVSKFLVKNDKFDDIGNYYFGNEDGPSKVVNTITINGKEYRIVQFGTASDKVIVGPYGDTFNYNIYETNHTLIKDVGLLYDGAN